MNSSSLKIVFALGLSQLLFLAACTPKNEPRYVHEGPKQWSPSVAPRDESVEVSTLNKVDLTQVYTLLKSPKADLMKLVLKPLSPFVLNAKFVSTPANRGSKLSQTVGAFESAFLQELNRGNSSVDFKSMKEDFLNTVFDGCTRDLRSTCQAADYFAAQPYHTKIMTRLARELDPQIEEQLKKAGTPSRCVGMSVKDYERPYKDAPICRDLIEERYRRLSMAMYNKRTHFDDGEFDFAYLKYASLFALYVEQGKSTQVYDKGNADRSLQYSYLAETNGPIFQTIIAKYSPEDYNSTEFKAFINAFNPWTLSAKKPDLFRFGTNQIFEFATKCCMYEDKAHLKLTPAVVSAIAESQAGSDHYGPSFSQMIKQIEYPNLPIDQPPGPKDKPDYDLFKNLKMLDLVQRIENPKSAFFDEYFFIVDRLFRGHLVSEQVERVLQNTNPARAQLVLPKLIIDYMKIYFVYNVFLTNRFMAGIYHSDVASDRIFEKAAIDSRDLTDKWHAVQSSIESLSNLMGSYFNGRNLGKDPSFLKADETIKAVNRNIHYLSVFPNMIVMNYFLTKLNGSINVSTWWGAIKFEASSILKDFFDGKVSQPWFHFGVDTEALDRTMLLYSTEYLLSTKALDAFVAKDVENVEDNQGTFFSVIFSKYLDDSVTDLKNSVHTFEQSTTGSTAMSTVEPMCEYETGHGGQPPVQILFTDLGDYTYSGINGAGQSKPLNDFLTGITQPMTQIRTQIDKRRNFVKALLKVISADLVRTGKIKEPGDTHPFLARAREILANLDELQVELVQTYLSREHRYFECAQVLMEVEKRRTKRLYEEERSYLSQVFDQMKTLSAIQDSNTLTQSVAQVNQTFFPNDDGHRFDHIEASGDKLVYRMSKYQLFMRMKKRIEGDVFMKPLGRELINYNEVPPRYLKPRHVTVLKTDAIERDPMVTNEMSVPVYLNGTDERARQDFILQGMATLNGSSNSYIRWSAAFASDSNLLQYLNALEELYLQGPLTSTDGKPMGVSKEELVEAYVAVYASLTLDNMDLQNARDFGQQGRYPKAFFLGRLFEKDGQTRYPFFFTLMNDVVKRASVGLKDDGLVGEALQFAKQLNSLQAFVFEPSPAVKEAVKTVYGEGVNQQLLRIKDLFEYLSELEAKASTRDVGDLDPRLKRPFFIEGNQTFPWYDSGRKNLTDAQKVEDHKILIQNFISQSGNFFATKQAVPLK